MNVDKIIDTPRIKFLQKEYHSKLLKALKADSTVPSGKGKIGVFTILLSMDVTSNKRYSQWLLKCYCDVNEQQRLLLEDVYKLKEPLELYSKLNKTIDLEFRDINKFKDYRSFLDYMDNIKPVESKRQIDKAEYEEALEGTDLVYEDDDLKLYKIRTKKAAIALGRGTRWCTASTKDDNNYFNAYKKALYIALCKDGRKIQIHIPSAQIMDEKDRPVGGETWIKYPGLENFFFDTEEKIMKICNTDIILLLDQEKFTFDMVKKIIRSWTYTGRHRDFISRILKHFNDQILSYFVSIKPDYINYIKNPSLRLQKIAIEKNICYLREISKPSHELVLYALDLIKDGIKNAKVTSLNRYANQLSKVDGKL